MQNLKKKKIIFNVCMKVFIMTSCCTYTLSFHSRQGHDLEREIERQVFGERAFDMWESERRWRK